MVRPVAAGDGVIGTAALAALLALGLPLAGRAPDSPAPRQAEPVLLIVAGVGGSPEHRERFTGWARSLCEAALATPRPPRVELLVERPAETPDPEADGGCAPAGRSRHDDIRARIAAAAGAESLFLVLIGHGTRVPDARFNLPGPDLTPAELDTMLDGFGGPVTVAHLASASGAFVPALSAPGRVILTASSGHESNETRFPRHFVAAFAGSEDGAAADRNKDGRVSALEAFDFARVGVEQEYERAGLLRTEHALLDDNGDGEGTRDPATEAGKDGILAARTALLALDADGAVAAGATNPELGALIAERDALAAQVDALREAREGLDEETYFAELEALLVEIAELNERIRAAAPDPPAGPRPHRENWPGEPASDFAGAPDSSPAISTGGRDVASAPDSSPVIPGRRQPPPPGRRADGGWSPARSIAGLESGASSPGGGPAGGAGAWPGGPEAAATALRAGKWDEAEAAYRDALADGRCAIAAALDDAFCSDARRGLAETLRLTGRTAEALDVLRAGPDPEAPPILLDRARIHIGIGEGRAGAELLRKILAAADAASLSEAVEAASRLGRLELRLGERESGLDRLDRVLDAYNTAPESAFTPRGLVAVGAAAARLGFDSPGLFRDALRVFDAAAARDPDDPEPRLAAGELLLSKFNSADAHDSFGAVLERNPQHPDALFGLARLPAAARPALPEGVPPPDPLETLLEVNPVHPRARALEVQRLLEAGRHEEAADRARDAAQSLPSSPEILTALGAVHFVAADRPALAETEAAFAAAWPGDPAFHLGIAEAAERQRLYQESARRAETALALAPGSAAAARLLGLNQLRLGDMEAGGATLEAAFDRDPFDALVKNNLDLLDELDTFPIRDDGALEVVLPADEAELLGPYAAGIAGEALETFRNRYGTAPDGTIRIEIYDRSADFSVRTVGIPGIGAHGVCFGHVIAMESPSAREADAYHWASTLWHELAHTIHMTRTGNRVPRWFTEGLSVLEERRRFGDGAPFAFYRALREERLLDVGNLDEGFIRPSWPGQVGVSYFHASLVLETLEDLHGFDAVLGILDGFGRGLDFSEALAEVAGTTPEELDAAADAVIEERYGAAARGLAAPPGGGAHPHGPPAASVPMPAGPDALVAAVADAPDDFARRLRAGRALVEAGRDEEATPHLERAAAIAPGYGGADGPWRLLAGIHDRAGRTTEAEKAFTEHLARVPAAYSGWLRLAELRADAGNPRGAAAALEAANWAYPLLADPHERLADAAAELGDADLEVRERRAALATGPADRADALFRLARAHYRAGDRSAARRRVLEALEIAPTFDDALELLLEVRRSPR